MLDTVYRLSLLFGVVLSVTIWGCTDKDSSKLPVHPSEPGFYVLTNDVAHIRNLSDSEVICVVNGEPLTKREFSALLRLRDAVWRLRQGKPLFCPAKEYAELELMAGPATVMDLIRRRLFDQYARKISAVPAEAEVQKAEKDLLATFKNMKDMDLETVANQIGGDAGEILRRTPYYNALDAILRQSVTTNDLSHVSEAEIQDRLRFVAEFDANAEEMNAKARKRLLAAKARILAGSDFSEEAQKIPDAVEPEFGKLWGTFELQEFSGEADLSAWLEKANVGDISEPLDLPDGLGIVRLMEKGKGEAPSNEPQPDTYTLQRCTVMACEKMQHQERPEMIQQLLRWKNEAALLELGPKLFGQAVIEYPRGTNLFDRVETEGKGK